MTSRAARRRSFERRTFIDLRGLDHRQARRRMRRTPEARRHGILEPSQWIATLQLWREYQVATEDLIAGGNVPLPLDLTGQPTPATPRPGIRFTELGEDGEQAVLAGHGLPFDQVARCLASVDIEDVHPEHLTEGWAVASYHSEACADEELPHEPCACDEYAWWLISVNMPRAHSVVARNSIAVTVWSA